LFREILRRVTTNPSAAWSRMSCMNSPSTGSPGQQPVDPGRAEEHGQDLSELLAKVARGDHAAFEAVYDELAAPVYGVARKVLRDPAQSEEVAQEVMLDVWRSASRFDSSRGSAIAWVMTIAHRRAVDRVRSENASAAREQKVAVDQVSEEDVFELVDTALDRQRVRRCMGSLTTLQAESIKLAYYQGYTYPQVAGLLGVALGTVKTRIRDGLIRMRDCLGVT
jgi:RNA polymerase sigma-70 factor, ECF subfamily